MPAAARPQGEHELAPDPPTARISDRACSCAPTEIARPRPEGSGIPRPDGTNGGQPLSGGKEPAGRGCDCMLGRARPCGDAAMTDRATNFGRVYEDHVWRVYGFLAYHLRDRDLAEDLTQTTFERALRAWSRFDPRRGSEAAWLLAIARNALVDHHR